MAQPPSEHDENLGSVDDFASESPVQPKYATREPVVVWVEDSQPELKPARPWIDNESPALVGLALGILVFLVIGGAGIAWWSFQPVPGEISQQPIASSRVQVQPIEPPWTVPSGPLSSDSDQAPSIDRDVLSVEKPQPARGRSSSGRGAEKQSPAAIAAADASHVSPPLPRPVPASDLRSLPPRPISDEDPPVRVAISEPPPPATAAPRPSEDGTTGGPSRSAVEIPESVAIQNVLGRYRTAFATLDAAGVHQVWPSVNQRSLERAFGQLEEQDVSFFSCTIDINGARAEAVCVGTTNFIPKVGSRSPQSGPSQWNFKLSKASAGGWLIDGAQAR